MHGTRARILAYLSNHPEASAADLSHVLGMTTANVRHHLRLLQRQRLVEGRSERRAPGRGRPTIVYRLSEQASPEDMQRLIAALWQVLVEGPAVRGRQTRLRHIAHQLAGPWSPPTGSLTQRLTAAVQRLQQLNYQARWEAHATAPRIILIHSPFTALQRRLPGLRELDQYLVEVFLGQSITPVEDRPGPTSASGMRTFSVP